VIWQTVKKLRSLIHSASQADGQLELPIRAGAPSGPLAFCGFFKNEGRYLKEWIEFHRLVGVSKFYLYNNNSTDSYLEVLKPYVEQGLVVLHRWKTRYGHLDGYNHCLKHYGKDHHWIGFMDLDEFCFPVIENCLLDVLPDYEKYGALGAHWVFFSTSGHILRPRGPVTQEYVWSQGVPNRHVKLLIRPSCVARFTSTHTVEFKDGFFAVDERQRKLSSATSDDPIAARIRINHYWTRSVEDFLMKKVPDGGSDTVANSRYPTELFKAERKYNQVKDEAVQRFLPRLLPSLSEIPS
jgi:hypothetical protein